MEELMSRARENLESLAAEIGLTIIRQVMEAEIEKKVGRWGQQPVHRYGQQAGRGQPQRRPGGNLNRAAAQASA